MGSVTVGEEVCPWGSILMFQKTCPRPSHKLTHAVHMYTHTEKLSGWMDGKNTFKEFSSLVTLVERELTSQFQNKAFAWN